MDITTEEILEFWFQYSAPSAETSQRWFISDPEFDKEIKTKFGAQIEAALEQDIPADELSAREALAVVILLDQFTRNIFRKTARAFAGDAKALAVADAMVESGRDKELSITERVFLYMPYQHAEDIAVHDKSIKIFTVLHAEAPENMKERAASNLDYAKRHRDIIARFGRFPHRNAVLGREPTEEEKQFLDGGGASFGQ